MNKKEEDKFKLRWDYLVFDHIYQSSIKVKKKYDAIFDRAKVEMAKFEKKNEIEIFLFFNHVSNELSLYSCDPNNYENTMICHHFIEYLNELLKRTMEYPQIS